MKQDTKETFSEVYEILNLMPDELVNKIPDSFYNMIKEGRDKEYKPAISTPISNQKLKLETTIVLGLIYRDFLTEKDERKILQTRDAFVFKKLEKEIEKEMKEKYDVDNILKNRNKKTEVNEEKVESKALTTVTEKEKWHKKLWKWIKNIFVRN